MHRLAKHRPSPAMVVACVALLVALGGTSVAAVNALAPNSVGPVQLRGTAVMGPEVPPLGCRVATPVTQAQLAASIALAVVFVWYPLVPRAPQPSPLLPVIAAQLRFFTSLTVPPNIF